MAKTAYFLFSCNTSAEGYLLEKRESRKVKRIRKNSGGLPQFDFVTFWIEQLNKFYVCMGFYFSQKDNSFVTEWAISAS